MCTAFLPLLRYSSISPHPVISAHNINIWNLFDISYGRSSPIRLAGLCVAISFSCTPLPQSARVPSIPSDCINVVDEFVWAPLGLHVPRLRILWASILTYLRHPSFLETLQTPKVESSPGPIPAWYLLLAVSDKSSLGPSQVLSVLSSLLRLLYLKL